MKQKPCEASAIKKCSQQEKLRASEYSTLLIAAIIVYLFHSHISQQVALAGVIQQWNIVFDADPNFEILLFAHGHSIGDFNHPLLPYIISLPLRAIAKIIEFLHLTDNPKSLRENLALYVPPILSAAKTIITYLVLKSLCFSQRTTIYATLFSTIAFSSIIFGSIPTSYILSGTAFITTILIAIRASKSDNPRKKALLYTCGVILTGITISNIIFFGWMLWLISITENKKPHKALVSAILKSGTILAATIAISIILANVRGPEPNIQHLTPSTEYIKKYSPKLKQQVENLTRFPEYLARSFIPTYPEYTTSANTDDQNSENIELSYNRINFGWSSLFLWISGALLLIIPNTFKTHSATLKVCIQSCTFSVCSYAILFSLFGLNTFLYSRYWQVPAIILLAASIQIAPTHLLQTLSLTILSIYFAIKTASILGDIQHTINSGRSAQIEHRI